MFTAKSTRFNSSERLLIVGVLCALQSCTQPPIGLSESLALIANVKQTPSLAEKICPTLSTVELQNQCWSTTPVPTDMILANERCKHLMNEPRSECYFNMAETYNNVEFCERAGPFEWDCRTHILQQNCGQLNSAKSLVRYATELQLNVHDLSIAGLLHRCLFFGKPQFNIKLCERLPHTEACRKWVRSLYTEKVVQSLNCTERTSGFKTFEDEDLERLLAEALQTHCPSQE